MGVHLALVLAQNEQTCHNTSMSHRFVLLRHECPAQFAKPSHWDFMLETDGRLMTWELRRLPTSWLVAFQLEYADASPLAPATRLADHRLEYLDYEGPISGDRGSVCCVDRGTYQVRQESAAQLMVELEGSVLSGSVSLIRQGNSWEVG
jgi:hypothetical protein